MKIKLCPYACIVGLLVFGSSCNKHNDYSNNVDVTREWKLTLSSSNENFINGGGETTAAFHMELLSDSSIRYDVKIDSAADKIVKAQISLGDPVSDGPLLLDLPVRVYGTYASGVLTGLSGSSIQALLNNSIEKYINITTESVPSGLVRGQLNSDLVLSKNVPLTGNAVFPSVTTNTTGTAFLRLTTDNKLYSKVVINNDDPADPVTTASINQAAAGANGPVIVSLVSSPAEFSTGKNTTVSSSQYSSLLSNSAYVTVNSALNPNGKIRGQIR